MKTLHIHIAVNDLGEAIQCYSSLLGAKPVKTKEDYAKWMLDEPRLNFAISTRSPHIGLDHLGIQVTDECEASAVVARLAGSGSDSIPEPGTTCCYARSDKHWVSDPAGIPWEIYRTLGDTEIYGRDRGRSAPEQGVCCKPEVLTGDNP